jgi:hypothetical protein
MVAAAAPGANLAAAVEEAAERAAITPAGEATATKRAVANSRQHYLFWKINFFYRFSLIAFM